MRHASAPSGGAFTKPLSDQLATAIGSRWMHGGDFHDLADQVVDEIAEHIRIHGIRGRLDPRLAEAIADAIRVTADADYAPAPLVPQPTNRQTTLADIVGVGCLQCRDARLTSERGWCSACDGAWPIDDRAVSL